MPEFTHLHVHTQYSILDGASDINKLFAKVKELGMSSIAITDHGSMYGVIEFYNYAKKHGIKPVIGCEMYVAEGSRFEKKGKEDRSGFHLILLAKNLTGYKNLTRLCSMGYKRDAFYYTPRIDKDLLREHSEGIIASSACIGGEIPWYILNNDVDKAENALKEYLEIFGEDFYLEFQNHGLKEQKEANVALLKLAEKYNVKCIATNDLHFIERDDSYAHKILICLNTGRFIDEDNNMSYSGEEFLKSPDEMAALFPNNPELLENTQEIVNKIETFKLEHDIILPLFPLPEGFETEGDFLRHLTNEGAKKLYPEITEEVRQRIDIELDVIISRNFSGYFLIVQDFINEAKRMDVVVGPGRGSAAGSIVAFCTGITSIDPIKYNLLFERFLNPERASMPDIDVDFEDEGREKVLEYVINKYGENHVAQIVTFGTMAAKSSIRDVARVLRLPLSDADRLAKLVPDDVGMTLAKAFKETKELMHEKENGTELIKKTLALAVKLEGSVRNSGTHACGVIIGPSDLMNYVPLATAKDSKLMVTQYEGKYIESVGMLKMDFLGLKNLSIIKTAIKNIKKRHNILIDIEKIPLEDKKTFELFQRGDTAAIFQFESDGMQKHLKELKPTSIEDLIAMNALYRPGPMDYIPIYISRKVGREKVAYPHPLLEEILKPTYGIMVYQEQIMQTAQIMGGYSLGKADILRRAMGKKKPEEMAAQKSIFVQGAIQKGIDKTNAEEVFDVMAKFAEYGFNRSHAAAYSVVAYQTAYLKAHYPAEYMSAVLTHNLSDIKKITFFIDDCRRSNIQVLGPDVNESDVQFTVNNHGEIRFGMGAIKGVGEIAANAIINERIANGSYKNFFDFIKRITLRTVNKRCLEALAIAGAFDCFDETHRAQFFYQENSEDSNFIEKAIKFSSNFQAQIQSSQNSLFGETDDIEIADPPMPNCETWSSIDQLKKEKEVIGFYISGHPLDEYKIEVDNFVRHKIEQIKGDLKPLKAAPSIDFAGIITSAVHKISKTGRPFGTFTVEDYTDFIQLNMFSEDYLKFKHLLNKDNFVFIRAKVQTSYRDENLLELKIASISLLPEVLDKMTKKIVVHLNLDEINKEFIANIGVKMKENKGNIPVRFKIHEAGEKMNIELCSNKIKVHPSDFLRAIEKSGINFKIS
jgi:DNA polymerase-3 subunit alpha